MKTLVDTSVWTLALRRHQPTDHWAVERLRSLIREYRVEIIGPIRQELLSGIRDEGVFESIRGQLWAFADLPLISEDFELAARFCNACRSRGVQGSGTDFLICAVSHRRRLTILTTDDDFRLFAEHLPIELAAPPG